MQVKLNVVGKHNISNSLAAIALSEYYGIDEASILSGLSDFVGTERRFELKGTFNGVTVIDDYAHHPTEITATLTAAQNIHTNTSGVYSSRTHTAEQEHFSKNLLPHSQMLKTSSSPIYMQQESRTREIFHQKHFRMNLLNPEKGVLFSIF